MRFSSIVLLLVAWRLGEAQRVRGVIRDSVSGAPVSGAVVTLTDSVGRMMSRSIGDREGRFAVVRIQGSTRLRVIRLGYRPADVPLHGLADSVVNVTMNALPPVLATVQTSTKRVCPGDGESHSDAGTMAALGLWEQARTALLASVVSRETNAPRLQLLHYDRVFEPVEHHLTFERTSSHYVVADRSYVAARPSWALIDDGYMLEDSDGRTFYAPDEGVLLDPRFAETHCLHVVPGVDGHVNDVGIGFEPMPDPRRDTLVDITGVLWIDRHLSALRSIDFKYTNLEPGADESDGSIVFETMPNGAPMIKEWWIRSTTLAYDAPRSEFTHRLPDRPDRRNTRTLDFRTQGGVVAEAVWPDSTRWHAPLPRITGIVVDMKNEPVPGIRVWLGNMPDTVTTNAEGQFALPYLFPRFYTIFASDSVLAAQGITRVVPRTVRFARGAATRNAPPAVCAGFFRCISSRGEDPPVYTDTHLRLQLRPRSDALSLLCPSRSYRPGTGVFMGAVVSSDGTPISGARIEVETLQSVVVGDTVSRRIRRSAEAGDDGKFVVCGAALDHPMVIRAFKDDESAELLIRDWKDGLITATINTRKAGNRD